MPKINFLENKVIGVDREFCQKMQMALIAVQWKGL